MISSGSKGGTQSEKDEWKNLGLLTIFYYLNDGYINVHFIKSYSLFFVLCVFHCVWLFFHNLKYVNFFKKKENDL